MKIIFKFYFIIKKKGYFLVKKKIFKSLENQPNYKLIKFGDKNKNKLFYVIKRFRGGGFFQIYYLY